MQPVCDSKRARPTYTVCCSSPRVWEVCRELSPKQVIFREWYRSLPKSILRWSRNASTKVGSTKSIPTSTNLLHAYVKHRLRKRLFRLLTRAMLSICGRSLPSKTLPSISAQTRRRCTTLGQADTILWVTLTKSRTV